MIEAFVMQLTSQFETIFSIAFSVIAIASTIAAATKTPADDEWIAKVYKIVDVLALNVGYAKEKPRKSKGGRFVAD